LNVMIPPAATAATTACEVQPAGVPVPITLVGCEVSAACACAGTAARPFGLPAEPTGAVAGGALWRAGTGSGFAFGIGGATGRRVARPAGCRGSPAVGGTVVAATATGPAGAGAGVPHAASGTASNSPATGGTIARGIRIARC
jgi:hypothetical protein